MKKTKNKLQQTKSVFTVLALCALIIYVLVLLVPLFWALLTSLKSRADFVENNPEAVARFLEEYKKSVENVNTNLEEGAALVEKYGIVNATVAQKAIPYCNIVFMEGTEMKTALKGCLEVLLEQNPASVGGQLPEDDFYYNAE